MSHTKIAVLLALASITNDFMAAIDFFAKPENVAKVAAFSQLPPDHHKRLP